MYRKPGIRFSIPRFSFKKKFVGYIQFTEERELNAVIK
jgi:hypothetical protein